MKALWWCLALAPMAQGATFEHFEPVPGQGTLGFYSNQAANPREAVIAFHGHPRDARHTFDAAQTAATPGTLVLAPLFQVPAGRADRCQSRGEPEAQSGDLLWSCSTWLTGGPASNAPGVTAFGAIDQLVAEVHRRWPQVQRVTFAGFSAGAQWVQHYAAFAALAPPGMRLRFVVASPGTWLYQSEQRPQPQPGCTEQNQWKYGLEQLPTWLPADAQQARQRYRQADITYLVGELDQGDAPGAHDRILDRSCAALAQGDSRRARAEAFTRSVQAPLAVVPQCAHEVSCVFPSTEGRRALNPG